MGLVRIRTCSHIHDDLFHAQALRRLASESVPAIEDPLALRCRSCRQLHEARSTSLDQPRFDGLHDRQVLPAADERDAPGELTRRRGIHRRQSRRGVRTRCRDRHS